MVIVVTLSEQDEPPAAVAARVTVFENPPRDATVMVEVPPGEPTFVVTLVGLGERLIPPEVGMVAVTVVELNIKFCVGM